MCEMAVLFAHRFNWPSLILSKHINFNNSRSWHSLLLPLGQEGEIKNAIMLMQFCGAQSFYSMNFSIGVMEIMLIGAD